MRRETHVLNGLLRAHNQTTFVVCCNGCGNVHCCHKGGIKYICMPLEFSRLTGCSHALLESVRC